MWKSVMFRVLLVNGDVIREISEREGGEDGDIEVVILPDRSAEMKPGFTDVVVPQIVDLRTCYKRKTRLCKINQVQVARDDDG